MRVEEREEIRLATGFSGAWLIAAADISFPFGTATNAPSKKTVWPCKMTRWTAPLTGFQAIGDQ